ncbi:MAG: type II toxin-antitoxin system RelE/ParE family toxin [Candidatus Eisenbacteria bacterium]
MADAKGRKPRFWVGSSLDELRSFPDRVKRVLGFALPFAQAGGRHADAKPLKGFAGAGVLEVVEEHAGDAFRGVYTVRFARAVYVLHVFQKKSKRGIETPRKEIELIRERLKRAEEHYEHWHEKDS